MPLVWKWEWLQYPNQYKPLFGAKDHCVQNSYRPLHHKLSHGNHSVYSWKTMTALQIQIRSLHLFYFFLLGRCMGDLTTSH